MARLIGLSVDHGANQTAGPYIWLKDAYWQTIIRAGGAPVALPPSDQPEILQAYIDQLSGIVITGGDFDISPEHYGEKDAGMVRVVRAERTGFERALLAGAWQKKMPILGICGGMQLLNVYRGGTLLQHVDHHEGGIVHEIHIMPETFLEKMMQKPQMRVRSTHHQAVGRLGQDLRVSARASDGVVEAIEGLEPDRFCVGLQWHPEVHAKEEPWQQRIFNQFIEACR